MSEVRNCLTCKWEPEWEDGGHFLKGACQSPVGPGVFSRDMLVYPKGSDACFAGSEEQLETPNTFAAPHIVNCPAHRPRD